jgi:hypothetical protein
MFFSESPDRGKRSGWLTAVVAGISLFATQPALAVDAQNLLKQPQKKEQTTGNPETSAAAVAAALQQIRIELAQATETDPAKQIETLARQLEEQHRAKQTTEDNATARVEQLVKELEAKHQQTLDLGKFQKQVQTTANLATTPAGKEAIKQLAEATVLLVRTPTRTDLESGFTRQLIPECLATKMQITIDGESTDFYATSAHCVDAGSQKFMGMIGAQQHGSSWESNLQPVEVAMINTREDCKLHPEMKRNPETHESQNDLAICRVQSVQGRDILPQTRGIPVDATNIKQGERISYLTNSLGTRFSYRDNAMQNATTESICNFRLGEAYAVNETAPLTEGKITGFYSGGEHAHGESGTAAVEIDTSVDSQIVSLRIRGVLKQTIPGKPIGVFEDAATLAKFAKENKDWLRDRKAYRDPKKVVKIDWGNIRK